ncbi:UDP-N-acetylglucosamine--N-acetylmuramyl-(pentapeptide) pyrophosphoryl-undecaprenol N-acetylglucosamine transferase [Listeria rocourtiae FSL F6-920]|nr:UDP-N-acetylglucosamine--N-acetylmuramyl-(pentapeptide) pyrophosphoryl-undecaprenol N-acetylglucosamine transferase [Listeria rocourtiae FSL F6-920]
MKFVISGGGTGGHIYPALALIRAIKKAKSKSRIPLHWNGKGLRINYCKA